MKPGILTSILLLFFCNSIIAQDVDKPKYEIMSVYDFELNYRIENKALLIDVREFFEYRRSRLKNAINIPSSGNLEFASDTISKDNALYLYCTTGTRSDRAAAFFGKQGFSKVYSLDGGIREWKKEGKPIEKRRVRRRD